MILFCPAERISSVRQRSATLTSGLRIADPTLRAPPRNQILGIDAPKLLMIVPVMFKAEAAHGFL